ncbi:MAG: hypothetical protein ACLT76_11860 [Clostridium fessum]
MVVANYPVQFFLENLKRSVLITKLRSSVIKQIAGSSGRQQTLTCKAEVCERVRAAQ